MYYRGKRAADLTESDLRQMVSDGDTESITLELKKEEWKADYEGRKELLKDISAMANSFGGLILLGVAENNHRAAEIVGVKNGVELQSVIINSCRSNLEEAIEGLDISVLRLQSGLDVVIVEIPESARKPHMVRYKDHWKVYRRIGTDNLPMGMREVREMVLYQEFSRNKAIDFLRERQLTLRNLYAGSPHIVLSLLPWSLHDRQLPFSRTESDRIMENRTYGLNSFIYHDSYEYTLGGVEANYKYHESALQRYCAMENGYVDVIMLSASSIGERGKIIPLQTFRAMINSLTILKRMLEVTGRVVPYTAILWTIDSVGLSLEDVNNSSYRRTSAFKPLRAGHLSIETTMLDLNLPEDELVYPVFEKFHRAFGIASSGYYRDGKFLTEYWGAT